MRVVTGMTHVVAFCFADVNPLTGAPYAQSRWCELPGFAADVVDRVGLPPALWDDLVALGATARVVDPAARGWPVACVELGRARAAMLHCGELAVAVAWSGVDLPRGPVSPDEALTLAAYGVLRHSVTEIRTAHQTAATLRKSGQPRKASELYGGVRREHRAHQVADDLVAAATRALTPAPAGEQVWCQPRRDPSHGADPAMDTDTAVDIVAVIGW